MKRIVYKILFFLMCIISASLLFTVGAFAETDVIGDTENVEEVIVESDSSENNLFGEMYKTIVDNSDKILSLFSFIGTLFIALLYKKGLIPGLKNALSSFKEALSEIRNESEKTSSIAKAYGERLEKMSLEIDSANNETRALNDQLKDDTGAKDRQIMKILLCEQIELLSDIFMSSSLPEYKKEEVGNRINKMKEALNHDKTPKQ